MKLLKIPLMILLFIFDTQAQNVGIGTATPVAKLNLIATGNNPSIPGLSSTGIFRIGVSAYEGIDFGKMAAAPYSGWIQAGFNYTADPLCLQPYGGNVGIGTYTPTNNLSVMGIADFYSPVGIGITTPATSAMLDITSVTKGFLPPRMTTVQRNTITNPVAGLQIWCTDCKQLQVYDGSVWQTANSTATYYPVVGICCQSWITKNLDVANYRNGDPIPKVTDAAAWAALSTGAYCYYNNDSATYAATYGKLYNWYAVNDVRGLVPEGWHIATDHEWTSIVNCLGGELVAGNALKEMGTTHWTPPNTEATNISGFTGLPGGDRNDGGVFNNIGTYGFWWSSTVYGTLAWCRYMNNTATGVTRTQTDKHFGFSVRCLRD